jgi:hypothetical protein
MKAIAALLMLALATSCATTMLWDHTDTYVAVSQDEISEDVLKAQGATYYRDDLRKVFFVEKRGMAKFRDYTIRTFTTPVTVMIDAATTIVVAGAIGGAWVARLVTESGGWEGQFPN